MPTSNPNSGRTSQRNATKGVELILGWPKAGGGSQVQSILFSRDTWDVTKAKKWLKQHGYRSIGLDVTEGKIRARQMEPGQMERFATKAIGNSADPFDRFNDLQKQGFMKLGRGKPPKKKKEMVTCIDCQDWHWKGEHTKDAATRKQNRQMERFRTKEIGNPSSKDPATMTAGQINSELDKLRKESMKLVQKFIDVGRGHERYSEIVSQSDPLSVAYLELGQRERKLMAEIEARYGPGHGGRLPVGRGFGPRRKNPSQLAEAEEMSQQFHGREPQEIIDLLEPEKYHQDLTKLGDLRLLELVLPGDMESGKVVPIQFAEDGDQVVELACTPDGNQLLLLAGDQTLDLEALEVPEDLQGKDYIEVGTVHSITYFTDKHHLTGPKYQKKGCEYVHVFASDEKGGIKPDLVYDRLNERIILTGGTYKVEERGIVN